jgi:spermidine synthase
MTEEQKPRWNELAALFLAGFATLLFEITCTKIFEFSMWSNYAYLVVGTAMFGLGFSGVLLTRWPALLKSRDSRFLPINAALCAVSMFGAFLVINTVPIHLPNVPSNRWAREFLNLAIVFTSLGLPFVFFGLIMSFLFDRRGKRANVYYFADLLGAGLGSFALVPLIPLIAPQGLVVVCSALTVAAAGFFLLNNRISTGLKIAIAAASVVGAGLLIFCLAPAAAGRIPLAVHVEKRNFKKDMETGRIEKAGWSALSRVDIVPYGENKKRLWIAGGINESMIIKFDGNYERQRAQRPELLVHAKSILDHKALPHLSKTNHAVCMIGTSGGGDSMYALAMGARKVVGIEMDPTIARFVTNEYGAFTGGLFTDGDYSELVVDEGRSYLRRSDRKFDVIQQVNNFTPIAFQNGALNISETYLLTVESFDEFYEHLSDDGILCISRYGSIRMLSTAVEMLRRRGMKPEEYSKHLFVCEGHEWVINTFMLKKSPFTEDEIDTLFDFFDVGKTNQRRSVLYAPYRTDEVLLPDTSMYVKIATAEDPSIYWRVKCFNFEPPTDNKPFFNRMKVFGRRDENRRWERDIKVDDVVVLFTASNSDLGGRVPQGDIPPLMILIEAFILASVFFGLPLLSKKSLREKLRGHKLALGYFACLGIAFIFVEICLIQRLVLFLGAPVYSLAAVLCSLLVAAGLGSLCSGRIKPSVKNIRCLLVAVGAAVIALHFAIPFVTDLFLGSSHAVRILVALVTTGAAGFLMGMPMPTGVRFLKEQGKPVIPWAWAVNGYFTVVGSALTVVLAMACGFAWVFVIACGLYVIAPFFLRGK